MIVAYVRIRSTAASALPWVVARGRRFPRVIWIDSCIEIMPAEINYGNREIRLVFGRDLFVYPCETGQHCI